MSLRRPQENIGRTIHRHKVSWSLGHHPLLMSSREASSDISQHLSVLKGED